MSRNKFTLLLIYVVTLISAVFVLPENYPLKFNIGKFSIDRRVNPPGLFIPFINLDKKISTHLGLDLLGGTQLVLEADMSKINPSDRHTALLSVREIIDRRVNFFGVSEPNVQTAQVGGSYRVIVEMPGIKDIHQAIETIGQTAQLEFREIDPQATAAGTLAILENSLPTGVGGADLKKAELSFDSTTGEPLVSFELTETGAKKFGELTTRLVGKQLPIYLDNTPISAPVVQTPITEGRGSITGQFTREEAKKLALQLSAGSLPAPIKIIEQKNIGASLGKDSVTKSIRAGIIGLLLVAVFMVIYYGKMGLIACVALIIYGMITFAIFRLIPVTLTLPGIAGFILSIGMAVDSNILIFERMKEELRKGKPWQIAMELGFGRAWDSIRDANITTILTAFILYNPLNWNFFPASGIVRGFALTLLLGVIISLFTGIIVSRNLLRTFYKPKEEKSKIIISKS